MQDLTVDRIIAVHAAIIGRDGGDSRIISEANLHQMVFRVNLLSDPFRRAALALYSLAAYPTFREGNIQTGEELAEVILKDGGCTLDPVDRESYRQLAEGVVSFTVEVEEIEAWLRTHARKDG